MDILLLILEKKNSACNARECDGSLKARHEYYRRGRSSLINVHLSEATCRFFLSDMQQRHDK